MKLPGPEHPISITPSAARVRISVGSTVIADSNRTLSLQEASYAQVLYIPRADVDMKRLTKTTRVTHCPYKGDASYYSIAAENRTLENAVWSYETPFPAMQEIAGYLAFYPDKVAVEAGN